MSTLFASARARVVFACAFLRVLWRERQLGTVLKLLAIIAAKETAKACLCAPLRFLAWFFQALAGKLGYRPNDPKAPLDRD